MPSLSTHVLDAAVGGPRPGVTVTVADLSGVSLALRTTDAQGRVADLASSLPVGTYQIRWATAGDFVEEVSVTVRLTEERHYHVPLLVSPVTAVAYLGV